ncbi:delta-class carbonic anhydrase [Sulfuricurvum sp.]|uniref:delta-class carbonic anhydrase n=1 Tax=Sulfuricurvum sp. TaxID=2025608 RepID=UPI0026355DFF|nr:delta-class carbonic anhydrase [Sulfuricurvum sp.]MDD2779952.1 delta-class carbonic anhydrase [Sulfuricurvum sp.]
MQVRNNLFIALAIGVLSLNGIASDSHELAEHGTCTGFGPQTPRDIDSLVGANERLFQLAPSYKEMNLCNIHFHENAEHKSKEFSIFAGEGSHGYESGYKCNISKKLTAAELAPTKEQICKNEHGDLVPGDTIEVHWVFSSCDVAPGKGLGSCVSEKCANPNLRVETQVFTLVNDPKALDFNTLMYEGKINGLHQPKALPSNTGKPVVFTGSTTGPSYSDSKCSPYQVTWSVRPSCAKVDINTVGKWCASGNVFQEDHAHGVRKLVTDPKLLSKIKKQK